MRDLPFVIGVALVASLVAGVLLAYVRAQRRGGSRLWPPALLGGAVVGSGVAYTMATLSPFSMLGTGVLPGDPEFPQNVNLVPVVDLLSTRVDLLVVNLALLVPFGFLLALRWPRLRLIAVAFVSTAFAVLIEVAQLFHPMRGTNIDDVLLNAAGAVIGAWIATTVRRRVVGSEAHAASGPEVGDTRGR